METTTYKRKPVYVEAVRVTQENFTEVAHWCQGGIVANNGKQNQGLSDIMKSPNKFISVRVINPQKTRHSRAFVGDWVLYSEFHGYKVYTDQAFKNAFDRADGGPSVNEAVSDLKRELQSEQVPDGTYAGARKA